MAETNVPMQAIRMLCDYAGLRSRSSSRVILRTGNLDRRGRCRGMADCRTTD